MRMDFNAKADGAAGALSAEQMRAILDGAITSTQNIIEDIVRRRL
jgi:hypothetical protein